MTASRRQLQTVLLTYLLTYLLAYLDQQLGQSERRALDRPVGDKSTVLYCTTIWRLEVCALEVSTHSTVSFESYFRKRHRK